MNVKRRELKLIEISMEKFLEVIEISIRRYQLYSICRQVGKNEVRTK